MAEFVQGREEPMIRPAPVYNPFLSISDLRNILNRRDRYEFILTLQDKQKSDFTTYIEFLKSILKEVNKLNSPIRHFAFINLHNKRIIDLYREALFYFEDDVSLWIEYIQFLMKIKRIKLLRKAINSALLLHGHISDVLYVFAVYQEFRGLRNIQKARETYTNGLHIHKYSLILYFEAFKCELANSKELIQNVLESGKELNSDDPALNGSVAKVIFESAIKNVKNDPDLYFEMHHEASKYNFSLDLSKEIKKFMLTTFSMDPNYWETLAINELLNTSDDHEKIKTKKCLYRCDVALLILDTDEMWDKYLATIIKIISDAHITGAFRFELVRQSLHAAHKKNKLKPKHYIQLIKKSKSSLTEEILEWAIEAYPNDTSILEMNIQNKLANKDELIAYKLLKHNAYKISPSIWLIIVEHFSNKPQISDIFNMIFGDESVCTNKVKQKLANKYLLWLSKTKSLNDARNAYLLLTTNSNCDASLCKTLVALETGQQIIDINKIRQHFTLACMQFGKTDIDLWMERICFEMKNGSPSLVSTTYREALKTLNNEESDQFAEQYALKASISNTICKH